jgi:hypothetical protein
LAHLGVAAEATQASIAAEMRARARGTRVA